MLKIRKFAFHKDVPSWLDLRFCDAEALALSALNAPIAEPPLVCPASSTLKQCLSAMNDRGLRTCAVEMPTTSTPIKRDTEAEIVNAAARKHRVLDMRDVVVAFMQAYKSVYGEEGSRSDRPATEFLATFLDTEAAKVANISGKNVYAPASDEETLREILRKFEVAPRVPVFAAASGKLKMVFSVVDLFRFFVDISQKEKHRLADSAGSSNLAQPSQSENAASAEDARSDRSVAFSDRTPEDDSDGGTRYSDSIDDCKGTKDDAGDPNQQTTTTSEEQKQRVSKVRRSVVVASDDANAAMAALNLRAVTAREVKAALRGQLTVEAADAPGEPLAFVWDNQPVVDALTTIAATGFSALPILEMEKPGKCVGVISVRDIQHALLHPTDMGVCETFLAVPTAQYIAKVRQLTPGKSRFPVIRVRQDDTLDRIIAKLLTTGVRRLLIADADEKLTGVVSLTDLGRYVARSLVGADEKKGISKKS